MEKDELEPKRRTLPVTVDLESSPSRALKEEEFGNCQRLKKDARDKKDESSSSDVLNEEECGNCQGLEKDELDTKDEQVPKPAKRRRGEPDNDPDNCFGNEGYWAQPVV